MTDEDKRWRPIEAYETAVPALEGLPEDHFAEIFEAYLASGRGVRKRVGEAETVLVDAPGITAFGVTWLEHHASGNERT